MEPNAVGLTRYSLFISAVSLGLVLLTTATVRVDSAIALNWSSINGSVAVLAGVGYWSLFGLMGALRARRLEGGAVLTLHMPFVVAGTILGGPVVGGWMGLLSQFERRELVEAPWYGVLANHGIIAIAAIAGGFAGGGAAQVVRSVGADSGTAQFAEVLTVVLVFAVVNLVLVTPIVAMRRQVTLVAALRSWDAIFRATLFAEAILAWLMALVYVSVGWWAPIACVALVLVIWEKGEMSDEKHRDPMTGLLNELGFMPRLESAVREARLGERLHALLIIDLDKFGPLNKDHGMAVGDEALVAVAGRLKVAVRDTDFVARFHRAGDEFAILLIGPPDEAIAVALAARIRTRISQPIVVRSIDTWVAVGASVGVLLLERNATSAANAIAIADRRMQYAKKHELGVLAEDPPIEPGVDALVVEG